MALDANEGACDEAERLARTSIRLAPTASRPYTFLADALVARGASMDSVRQTLADERAVIDPAYRPRREATERYDLALLEGRFADAFAATEASAAALQSAKDEGSHAEVAERTSALQLELGDLEGAKRTADEFAARRDAWGARSVLRLRAPPRADPLPRGRDVGGGVPAGPRCLARRPGEATVRRRSEGDGLVQRRSRDGGRDPRRRAREARSTSSPTTCPSSTRKHEAPTWTLRSGAPTSSRATRRAGRSSSRAPRTPAGPWTTPSPRSTPTWSWVALSTPQRNARALAPRTASSSSAGGESHGAAARRKPGARHRSSAARTGPP